MKNLILAFLFALSLAFIPGSCKALSQAEHQPTIAQLQQDDSIPNDAVVNTDTEGNMSYVAPVKKSIFQKAKDWMKGESITLIIGLLFGFLATKGWSQRLKWLANKGSSVTKEIGETFNAGSVFFNKLDDAIKEDGKLKENSVGELLAAGKEVMVQANDVILSIKPKKQ